MISSSFWVLNIHSFESKNTSSELQWRWTQNKVVQDFFLKKKQWNSTLQYSYSEVSEETSTKLVFTRPTSPVASFFPVNQSKHETRSPMMIMTSPGATLSSSGHSASCICVATHFPLAEEVKQQHVSQHLCKGGFSLWNSNKYVFHLCRSAFIFVLPDKVVNFHSFTKFCSTNWWWVGV